MDQHLWSPEHYILTPKVVFQTWRNFNTFTFPRIRVALNHWFLHSTCFFFDVFGVRHRTTLTAVCVVLSSSARSWCLASHVLPNHSELQTMPVRVEHLDRRWLVFVQKICIFLKIFWFCVWVFRFCLILGLIFCFKPACYFFLVFFWCSHRSWDSETMQSPGPMNSTRDTTDEQTCVMHAHCICRHLPSLETQRFLQQTRNGHGDILTLMFRHLQSQPANKTSFP